MERYSGGLHQVDSANSAKAKNAFVWDECFKNFWFISRWYSYYL